MCWCHTRAALIFFIGFALRIRYLLLIELLACRMKQRKWTNQCQNAVFNENVKPRIQSFIIIIAKMNVKTKCERIAFASWSNCARAYMRVQKCEFISFYFHFGAHLFVTRAKVSTENIIPSYWFFYFPGDVLSVICCMISLNFRVCVSCCFSEFWWMNGVDIVF